MIEHFNSTNYSKNFNNSNNLYQKSSSNKIRNIKPQTIKKEKYNRSIDILKENSYFPYKKGIVCESKINRSDSTELINFIVR